MSEKARIIIVEDDEGNRRSLVRALTREGYRVDAFREAESALRHLQQHRRVDPQKIAQRERDDDRTDTTLEQSATDSFPATVLDV